MIHVLTALAAITSTLALTASAYAQETGDVRGDGVVEVGSDLLGVEGTAQAYASGCGTGGCESGGASVGLGVSQSPAGADDPASASASACVLGRCTDDIVDQLPTAPLPDINNVTCLVRGTCGGGRSGSGNGSGDRNGAELEAGSPGAPAAEGPGGGGTSHPNEPPTGDTGGGASAGGVNTTGGGVANGVGGRAVRAEATSPATDGAASPARAGTSSREALDCSAAVLDGPSLGGESGQPPKTGISRVGAATGPIAGFGWAALGAALCALLFTTARSRIERARSPKEWSP